MTARAVSTCPGWRSTRCSATPACTLISDMWCATTSCSSRAIRSRSSFAWRRTRLPAGRPAGRHPLAAHPRDLGDGQHHEPPRGDAERRAPRRACRPAATVDAAKCTDVQDGEPRPGGPRCPPRPRGRARPPRRRPPGRRHSRAQVGRASPRSRPTAPDRAARRTAAARAGRRRPARTPARPARGGAPGAVAAPTVPTTRRPPARHEASPASAEPRSGAPRGRTTCHRPSGAHPCTLGRVAPRVIAPPGAKRRLLPWE